MAHTAHTPWIAGLLAWLVALLVIGVLDGLWLGVIARDLYRSEMGDLMAPQIRLLPAAAFYLLYPAGLVFLLLATRPESITQAAVVSAVIGLMAYGAYDMTNLAVIRGWSARLSLIDWCWGTLATTCGGVAAWLAVRDRLAG